MSRHSSTDSEAAAPSSADANRRDAGGRILHLDAFSGIAGNMFVGALLDLGLSRDDLEADLGGLDLDFKLRVQRVSRGALAATYFDVAMPSQAAHDHDHSHGEAEAHVASVDHHHPHDGEHGHSHREICAILERAKLSPRVRDRARAIFDNLAEAEAHVHGVAVEDVHFHEAGAIDAIVDVTSAAIGLERLGITRVSCSPIALGSGTVETAHGLLPLPAPATLELLRGIPTVPAHVEWETATPTGAAIARTLVDEFGPLPAMQVEAIGYGAGRDREAPMPNVLRAVVGRCSAMQADRVVVLESNLDDLVPEHFEHLMGRLFAAGALDVSLQNIQMKKNRPGFCVRILGRPSDRRVLAETLMAESTAIGVRTSEWERLMLAREGTVVTTEFGEIRVKVIVGIDGARRYSAEYDDCARAAAQHGAALRDVVAAAEAVARASAV